VVSLHHGVGSTRPYTRKTSGDVGADWLAPLITRLGCSGPSRFTQSRHVSGDGGPSHAEIPFSVTWHRHYF